MFRSIAFFGQKSSGSCLGIAVDNLLSIVPSSGPLGSGLWGFFDDTESPPEWTVFELDILAQGVKVEFWECEGALQL